MIDQIVQFKFYFLFIRLEVLLILINIISERTILGSSTKAEAFKCYACNSVDDSWCEDKDNLEDAGEQAYMECSIGEQNCLFSKTSKKNQIVIYIEAIYGKFINECHDFTKSLMIYCLILDTDDTEGVVRDCTGVAPVAVADDCVEIESSNAKGTICYCSTSLCNSARQHSFDTILGVMTSVLMMKNL